MANWETVNDCLEDLLRRGGELAPDQAFDASASPYTEQALRYLNRSLQFMKLECNWLWDRKDPPGALRINRIIQGEVTVTQDLTAIVLDSAPSVGLGSLAGWKIDIGGSWYRIATHVAGDTAAELDSPYNGATGTESYALYQDEITLPADCENIHVINLPDEWAPLERKDAAEFRREFPNPTPGIPAAYTIIGEQKIRIDQLPQESMRAEIEYERIADMLVLGGTTASIPLLPHKRHILVDGALFFIFMDKDDIRVDAAGGLFRRGLDLLKGQQQSYKATDSNSVVEYREF